MVDDCQLALPSTCGQWNRLIHLDFRICRLLNVYICSIGKIVHLICYSWHTSNCKTIYLGDTSNASQERTAALAVIVNRNHVNTLVLSTLTSTLRTRYSVVSTYSPSFSSPFRRLLQLLSPRIHPSSHASGTCGRVLPLCC